MYLAGPKAAFPLLLIFLCLGAAFGQDPVPTPPQLGGTVTRSITAGETEDVFTMPVKRGQFVRVDAAALNLNIVVSLVSDDGKTVAEIEGDQNYLWQVSLLAIAENSGSYTLRIKGAGAAGLTSSYWVKLVDQRKSRPEDGKLIAAQQKVLDAIKLGTDAKIADAQTAFQAAAQIWHDAGDRFWEAVCLWNAGWDDFSLGRADDALKLHGEALAIFREIGDRVGESAALNGIGNVYGQKNDLDAARTNLEQSLAIARELDRPRSELSRLNGLTSVYSQLGLSDKLEESLERMLDLTRELRSRADEREALNRLGLFFGLRKENAKAAGYFTDALTIDRELNDVPGQIDRLTFLAEVDPSKSEGLLTEALGLARTSKDPAAEAIVLNDLGDHYQLNCGRAREYFLKAYEIAHNLKDHRDIENTSVVKLLNVSVCLGDNDKVLEYAEAGLKLSIETGDTNKQVTSLMGLGMGFDNTGQFEKAKENFQNAVTLAEQQKFIPSEITSLLSLANLYVLTSDYDTERALELKALAIARAYGNVDTLILALNALATNYAAVNDMENARLTLEEALAIAQKANDHINEADVLHSLGRLYTRQGQYATAREYMDRSLKIARDNGLVALALYVQSSIGNIYVEQSQFEEAIAVFDKAIAEAKEAKNLNWTYSLLVARGNALSMQNRYTAAAADFQQALDMATKVKNLNHQAIALIGLGDIYFKLNQYEAALQNFKQVEAIAAQTKNRWMLGYATGGIGSINVDVSQNVRARGNYEQSLTLMQQVMDRTGEGNVLNALGNTYLALKDYDKAQGYYERSLAIAKETSSGASEIAPLINLGVILRRNGKPDQALASYTAALAQAEETKDRSGQGHALQGIGELESDKKQTDAARDHYLQALAIARQIQSKKLEGSVLQDLMDLYKGARRPQLAILYGKLAINAFQAIRANIKGLDKESRQSYVKDKESTYRNLADMLISEDRFPEAQAVLDLLKDEEYAQLERGDAVGDTVPYSGIETASMKGVEDLISLEHEREDLLKIKGRTPEQEARAKALLDEISAANRELDGKLTALKASDKGSSERVDQFLRNNTLKAKLTDLRLKTKSRVAALYTLIGDADETSDPKDPNYGKPKFGWVILVTEYGQKAYPIDVTDLKKTIFDFRDALSTDKYDPTSLAQKLYDAIFRQTSPQQKRTLEQDLHEYFGNYADKTLMWSLDGVLRYVPMAALNDGQHYLVEDYRNVLFTDKSEGYLLAERRPDWQVLGLGVSDGRDGFPALPGVKTELEAIVRGDNSTTGVLKGEIDLNDNFKKLSFFNAAASGEYPVVHIASHYAFKPGQQNESFLLTGDGPLTFAEMDNNAGLFGAVDLMTLSACDTGVTDNGKETEGFAYKAQELGAKSVIASLWEVSDKGTPELMVRFYKSMADDPVISKGEAFRQAQLSLLRGNAPAAPAADPARAQIVRPLRPMDLPLYEKDPLRPFAHPHYWASFVLIGNWR